MVAGIRLAEATVPHPAESIKTHAGSRGQLMLHDSLGVSVDLTTRDQLASVVW
jgi:hypothetical protein